METKNYGLAGGTLDATTHVERFGTDAYNRLLQAGTTINYRQPGGVVKKDEK